MSKPSADDIADSDELYARIHRKAWPRRLAASMAGMMVVGALGVVTGLAVAFIPPVLAALHVAGAEAVTFSAWKVVETVATFTSFGTFIGMGAGADIGGNAAAMAAGIEELNKEKSKAQSTEVEPRRRQKEPIKWFDWKVAAFWVLPVAAFGALIAINPITAATAFSVFGLEAGSTAAIAASTLAFAIMGISWGTSPGAMTAAVTDYYMKTFRGNFFGAREQEVAIQPQKLSAVTVEPCSVEKPVVSEPDRPSRSFSTTEKRCALEAILDKSENRNTVLTR